MKIRICKGCGIEFEYNCKYEKCCQECRERCNFQEEMRMYLCQVEIRDGENEYNAYFLSENIDVGLKEVEKYFGIDNFTRKVRMKSMQKIRGEEMRIVKKLGLAFEIKEEKEE